VAAKVALAQSPATLAYCDTGSEHPDNSRFMDDLEAWYGQEILRLHSDRYSDVDDVIEKRRYLSGHAGALCTTELKRMVRFAFQRPDDRQVYGYTCEETKRARHAEHNDPGINWWWPLIDAQLTKADCLAMIERAGIELPAMYRLGYDHNNCLGYVKATSPTYWNMVRVDFPEVFARRARQERELNHALAKVEDAPVFLDELDPDLGKGRPLPNIECSLMCAIAESSIAPPVQEKP
jgi:hypothetical protein